MCGANTRLSTVQRVILPAMTVVFLPLSNSRTFLLPVALFFSMAFWNLWIGPLITRLDDLNNSV